MGLRLAIFLVAVALFSCGAAIAAASDNSLDYFRLVLTWPGSYCKEGCGNGCCRPTTGDPKIDFLVKGLYPYSGRQLMSKCSGNKFLMNAIASMVGDLFKYWPSIECPSNNGMEKWRNLWQENGVCSGFNQTTYFRKTLDLRAEVNLLSLLERNNINPTDRFLYFVSFIKKVISIAIGAPIEITCNSNQWGQDQIYEIHMCVDKTGTKFIQCPYYPSCNCGRRARFPTFDLNMLNDTSLAINPIEMPISE